MVRRFLGTRRCFAFAGTSLLQGGSWLDLLEVVSQPPHRILLEIYSRLHAELTGEPETLDPEVDD